MKQQEFWRGEFGDQYISRNSSRNLEASNLILFADIVGKNHILPSSILEFGPNIGLNIKALKLLLPNCEMSGVEINKQAADVLRETGVSVFHDSIEDVKIEKTFDLVLSKGVLIHINPNNLPSVYDKLYNLSKKWILIIEYFAKTPTEVVYRGHEDVLFKRDFAAELLDRFSEQLKLINYGFVYHRDLFPQDDLTWFLLEKI